MSESQQQPTPSNWQTAKRRAGCLLGCLTEPFVLVALVLGGLLGGYFWGRKSERRLEAEPEEAAAEDND
jgi:hypothetical protein